MLTRWRRRPFVRKTQPCMSGYTSEPRPTPIATARPPERFGLGEELLTHFVDESTPRSLICVGASPAHSLQQLLQKLRSSMPTRVLTVRTLPGTTHTDGRLDTAGVAVVRVQHHLHRRGSTFRGRAVEAACEPHARIASLSAREEEGSMAVVMSRTVLRAYDTSRWISSPGRIALTLSARSPSFRYTCALAPIHEPGCSSATCRAG